MNPNNGSALGLYQSAMQIRRNSRLNCFNSIAVGYPVGLILDNEKGNTQGAATGNLLKLQNIWFAGMDILGADANKSFSDHLVTGYEDSEPVYDNSKPSFSSTFFLAQTGNRNLTDMSDMQMNDNGYMPMSGSPVLTAASFSGMNNWITNVSYIGAFNAGDTWADGWTNFDPENTDY